jgi:hypothetical protein
MKQVVIPNSKLAYTKEQVANLSENDLDKLQGGGNEEAAKTASSTNNDFTCCWCTSTVTQPDEQV